MGCGQPAIGKTFLAAKRVSALVPPTKRQQPPRTSESLGPQLDPPTCPAPPMGFAAVPPLPVPTPSSRVRCSRLLPSLSPASALAEHISSSKERCELAVTALLTQSRPRWDVCSCLSRRPLHSAEAPFTSADSSSSIWLTKALRVHLLCWVFSKPCSHRGSP